MGSVSGKSTVSSYVPYQRRAHHAGSWYSNEISVLNDELQENLDQAAATINSSSTATTTTTTTSSSPLSRGTLRGVICPHAGYSYSGPTAAYSYKALENELIRRHNSNSGATTTTKTTTIVVLHPSHHVYLENCAVSGATVLHTPVGDLPVDETLRQEILQTQLFSVMKQSDDEREHSGEMQYPYLAKIVPTGMKVQVLPIMCGNLTHAKEALFGRTLSDILQRPTVLTVVSTDFCHWGRRFSYQPTDQQGKIPIHEYIREMDHRGMDVIAHDWQRPGAFAEYLRETRNTICGRHAIAVWLHALAEAYPPATSIVPCISFIKYEQSSAAKSMHDSSVSYAAALCTLETPTETG